MSTIDTLWRYGPRIFVAAIALTSISAEIAQFFKELGLTKDLPSDALMTRIMPIAITTAFFIGIQVQRITACFTSTTILAQLAFYIWTVECFFKACILFGTIALLSFNKDFADKIEAIHNDSKLNVHAAYSSGPMFWVLFYGSFWAGIGLRMILNELRSRDREAERRREALLRIAKDMPPFPITTARALTGFSDVVLTEEDARGRLLRVRTWPRVVSALIHTISMVAFIEIMFNHERLAGLRWHQYLEFIVNTINTCVGLYALYRKSLRLSRGCLSTFTGLVLYGFYFRIKGLVKLYRNGDPSSTSMTDSLVDVLTADDSTAKSFPFAEAVLGSIFDSSIDLFLVWSVWQTVKDLEERNSRIAKARVESRMAAASSATFTDEKGDTVYNV